MFPVSKRIASIRVDKILSHDMTKVLTKIGAGIALARTPQARVRLYQTALLAVEYGHILEEEFIISELKGFVSEYKKLPWYKKIFR